MEPNTVITLSLDTLATITGGQTQAVGARGAYDQLAAQVNEQNLHPGRSNGSSSWFQGGKRYVSGTVGSTPTTCWRSLKGPTTYGCSTPQ